MLNLTVPLSRRQEFYWQMHVTLDQARTKGDFAELLLSKLGVDATSHRDFTQAMRTRLPSDIDDIDVTVVAAILEEFGYLSWVNDIRTAPAGFAENLERAVADTLRAAPRGAMPRQVTEQLLGEVSRLLGALVDSDVARALHDALLSRLECELWRRDTEERMLVSWLCEDVMRQARVG